MPEDPNHSIKGDRALGVGDEDRLGFREVAKQIASSLVDRATEDGLVIGLEGAWGSGKSSLLFLIDAELDKFDESIKPTVINFKPWLIGNRDALILDLFTDLLREIDNVALKAGDATGISVTKAKEAGAALRRFVHALGKAGAFAEFIGKASGIGLLEVAGEGAKSLGEATDSDSKNPPLSDLKNKLAKSLRELNHRFVVTIDDVDRLEPSEITEILRLVRSVVDLPSIVYLLCYDLQIITQSVEAVSGITNGKSYLEKIVQVTVSVPLPEPFQLRQWFTDELRKIASTKSEDERLRLQAVIDVEGGRQLRTPRSVVRTLDAMRFFWPPLSKHEGDLADLVWLHLIKEGNSSFYRWIEDYCATVSIVSLGIARVDDAERKRRLDDLRLIAGNEYLLDVMNQHQLAEILPGIAIGYAKNDGGPKLFCAVADNDRDQAIRNRRLSSPDHYRIYFALTVPSHVFRPDETSAIWAAAEGGADAAGEILLRLNSASASGALTKADLLLERLKGGAYDTLNTTQRINLLIAFSKVMDQAYRERKFDINWVGTLWDRTQELIPQLLEGLEDEARDKILKEMFDDGPAIGWLTSLFRREIFAHGRYAHRPRPEVEWLITDTELDRVTTYMLARYRHLSMKCILSSPAPISLLFAWQQAGDETGPRRAVNNSIASDEGLIETLEGFTSTIKSSNRGSFQVLQRQNLEEFVDYNAIKARVENLVGHPNLGGRAIVVLEQFRDGEKF